MSAANRKGKRSKTVWGAPALAALLCLRASTAHAYIASTLQRSLERELTNLLIVVVFIAAVLVLSWKAYRIMNRDPRKDDTKNDRRE